MRKGNVELYSVGPAEPVLLLHFSQPPVHPPMEANRDAFLLRKPSPRPGWAGKNDPQEVPRRLAYCPATREAPAEIFEYIGMFITAGDSIPIWVTRAQTSLKKMANWPMRLNYGIRHARAYTYRGLRAFALLSMARNGRPLA